MRFEVLGAPGSVLAAIAHKCDLLDYAKLRSVTTVAVVGQALRTRARDVLPEHFHCFILCGSDPFFMNLNIFGDRTGYEWEMIAPERGKNIGFTPLLEAKWWHTSINMKRAIFTTDLEDPWYPIEALKAFAWRDGAEHSSDMYSMDDLGDEEECLVWNFECDTNDLMWIKKGGAILNPLPLEQHMANHPLLKDAVLVGARLSRAVLLMQLREPSEIDALDTAEPNFVGGLTEMTVQEARAILKRNDMVEILDALGEEVDYCKQFHPFLRSMTKEYVAVLEPDFKIPRAWDGKIDRKALAKLVEKAQQDCTMRAGARFRLTEWFEMISAYL